MEFASESDPAFLSFLYLRILINYFDRFLSDNTSCYFVYVHIFASETILVVYSNDNKRPGCFEQLNRCKSGTGMLCFLNCVNNIMRLRT